MLTKMPLYILSGTGILLEVLEVQHRRTSSTKGFVDTECPRSSVPVFMSRIEEILVLIMQHR